MATGEDTKGHGFGTAPVFLAAISTILGAVMFLRFGYAVGHAGVLGALMIVLVGHLITIPTALAVSEIATNRKVEGGGEYFIISRSFGTTIGGAIGITLYLSRAISVAFYMIALTEAFKPLFPIVEQQIGFPIEPRMVGVPAVLILLGIMLRKGADLGVKALWVVVVVLGVSLVAFFAGMPPGARGLGGIDLSLRVADPDSFARVFAICFPAFTGMTAGVGLSGDLADPRRSIPLGTMAATLTGMVVYVLVVIKLHLSASPEDLAADPLIMEQIAVWGPMVLIGLAAATLSSAVGSVLVAPRILQALAGDRVFPAGNAFLSRGSGEANEPVNATLVTAVIAVGFVAIGDIDSVAQIISMFFMLTYGTLCAVSFLEHFAGNPSYRPSFRSKWYLSLAGSVICIVMMFQMSTFYAGLSLTVMVGIYLGIRSLGVGGRGLAAVFQGVTFQLTRWLQIFMQKKHATARSRDWRPSFFALSRHTLDRLAPFEVLKWISHQHGFGSFIHYVEGHLSREQLAESRRILHRMISRTQAGQAGIYVDTVVSQSFMSAVEHGLQMPGVSGLETNSVLFEFAADHPGELVEICEASKLSGSLGYNTCVLRSSENSFGYKRNLHVWLTRYDETNTNLMILLGYIILGHPDWKRGEITIFVTFPSQVLKEQTDELHDRIASGRLPISLRNVRALPRDDEVPFDRLVEQHSDDADLIVLGYTQELLDHKGEQVFLACRATKDILFVNANQEITIA